MLWARWAWNLGACSRHDAGSRIVACAMPAANTLGRPTARVAVYPPALAPDRLVALVQADAAAAEVSVQQTRGVRQLGEGCLAGGEPGAECLEPGWQVRS